VVEHVVAQGLPVEGAVLRGPAERARILQVLGKLRAVDQHLLGHAAADHAGAADAVLLRHRHPRTMRRGHARGTHAAGARADGEEVVIVAGHASLLLRAAIWRAAGRAATAEALSVR